MKEIEAGKYVLGIDAGANSLGWAVLSIEDESKGGLYGFIDINAAGARIFEAGMEGDIEAGKEESRAKKRREARLIRRQAARRAMRTYTVYSILQDVGLLPNTDTTDDDADPGAKWNRKKINPRMLRDQAMAALDKELLAKWRQKLEKEGASQDDVMLLAKRLPYVLRARALSEPLDPHDLGRALYQLAQRRGFLSNRKATPKKDEEDGKVKEGIKKLGEDMESSGVRTLGQYFAGINPEDARIRARWTSREMYMQEFREIWEAQKAHHPGILTDELEQKLHHAIFYQRPLKSQSHLIGFCEHEPTRTVYITIPGKQGKSKKIIGARRAPMAILDFQRFRILQVVNNIRIQHRDNPGPSDLTEEQRLALIQALEATDELKISEAKKVLKLKSNEKINFESGPSKKLVGNRTAAAMRKIFGERWDQLTSEDQDQVIEDILSIQNNEALIRRMMNKWGLDHESAKKLAEPMLESDYCGLSRKALKKLLPLMEQGTSYMTAVAQTYDPPPPEPVDLLPPVSEVFSHIRNPVVMRTLTEMRKVINAVIRQYGKPAFIRIELAREMKNPKKKRQQTSKDIAERTKQRDKAREAIMKEAGLTRVTRTDTEKYLLAEECGWECPYTGRRISMDDLFGMNPCFDIEHIIPFSRSLDNSFFNKTLCWAEENRNHKHSRTPLEAYAADEERWGQIIERVKKFKGEAAEEKLCRFRMNDEDLRNMDENFTQRQLTDTRYASKLACEYLGLIYGARNGVDANGTRRIQAIASGRITAHLRNELSLNGILNDGGQKTREDHRHHAVDAVCIALTDPATVKQLMTAAKNERYNRDNRLAVTVDPPWPGFQDDVREAITAIIVSHRVSRKVNGALHEETNYGRQRKDEKEKPYVHIRRPLDALSAKDLDLIVDPVVQEAVKRKIQELGGGEPKKLFAGALALPPDKLPAMTTRDGRKRTIRRVRVRKNVTIRPVAEGPRQRNIITGSNHHIEIFEYTDKKGNKKWDAVIVTTYEAMRRKRAKPKEPVVNRDHGPGKKFLFSLTQGEVIELDEENGQRGLYLVRAISYVRIEDREYPNLAFVMVNDARLKKEIIRTKKWFTGLPEPLRKKNCKKVSIDPLGGLRKCHD